ncbi:hypothetical protein [Cryobacterium aureum]|uniref:hypothetical protein n=1 Tax=Cryobacterium aureum TaxID=995037 RepID=UPI000CF55BFF|nr:hypothetical protein [Cryobacterium aureum]
MTKPPAPYRPEPTHGQSIVDNDRRRRATQPSHRQRVGQRSRRRLFLLWFFGSLVVALTATAGFFIVNIAGIAS